MQMDEIVERLENEVSPSEIFAALFELELAGKIKQLPGKNFVKTFPASFRTTMARAGRSSLAPT
jgi:hypothetical protein